MPRNRRVMHIACAASGLISIPVEQTTFSGTNRAALLSWPNQSWSVIPKILWSLILVRLVVYVQWCRALEI